MFSVRRQFAVLAVVLVCLTGVRLSHADWQEQGKLLASDGAANDHFGWPVYVSGDYAVVGGYFNDDNGIDSGSA
jgi:hypothetical protein